MKQTKITRINYAIETYRKNCSSYAFELSKSRLSKDPNYRECLLGRDSIYIPIDKCASNSMRKVLTENGFISMQKIRDWDKALEKFKDWNHFAVVRQPVDRYISGLTEFIFRNSHKNPYEYIEKSLSQNKFISNQTLSYTNQYLNKGKQVLFFLKLCCKKKQTLTITPCHMRA